MGSGELGWVLFGMLGGAGLAALGWWRAAGRWPSLSAVARRLDDLERAFPAWQSEMVKLASSATDQYAQAKVERERAQAQHAGTERARRKREEEAPPDPEAALRQQIAHLPADQQQRAIREYRKTQIAARY